MPNEKKPPENQGPKLLERMRAAMRVRHLARRTEKSYVGWVRRFIRFHGLQHPEDLGEAEVAAFLSYLATDRRVSASTQKQALCALIFLYQQVLGIELGELKSVRARQRRRLPVVLTVDEVRRLLGASQGTPQLVLTLLYAPACGCSNACKCGSKMWTSVEV